MNIFSIDTNVKMSSAIVVNLSANDWSLHTGTVPRHTIEKVATYLNNRFNQGYNRGMTKEELSAFVTDLMNNFRIYGAAESEPRLVLDTLLEKVYP